MASRASSPPRLPDAIGTPITGSDVTAARTPARWAALPAPAINTPTSRPAASRANRSASSGVRWAESTRTSTGTPNSRSASMAPSITGASDPLPITTPTVFMRPPSSVSGPVVLCHLGDILAGEAVAQHIRARTRQVVRRSGRGCRDAMERGGQVAGECHADRRHVEVVIEATLLDVDATNDRRHRFGGAGT